MNRDVIKARHSRKRNSASGHLPRSVLSGGFGAANMRALSNLDEIDAIFIAWAFEEGDTVDGS